MSDLWKSWPGAPKVGSALCPRGRIPDGGTLCLLKDGFPVALVRKGDSVKAFVNACPHHYLPLNHRSEKLLSADGKTLRCSNHSAGFSSVTGEGVEGLGIGACLDVIPVSVSEEDLIVVCETIDQAELAQV